MRYFFEFSDQPDADMTGAAFASFDEMRREARRALVRIAAETEPDDDEIALALQVRDEQGACVYNICLSIKGNQPRH